MAEQVGLAEHILEPSSGNERQNVTRPESEKAREGKHVNTQLIVSAERSGLQKTTSKPSFEGLSEIPLAVIARLWEEQPGVLAPTTIALDPLCGTEFAAQKTIDTYSNTYTSWFKWNPWRLLKLTVTSPASTNSYHTNRWFTETVVPHVGSVDFRPTLSPLGMQVLGMIERNEPGKETTIVANQAVRDYGGMFAVMKGMVSSLSDFRDVTVLLRLALIGMASPLIKPDLWRLPYQTSPDEILNLEYYQCSHNPADWRSAEMPGLPTRILACWVGIDTFLAMVSNRVFTHQSWSQHTWEVETAIVPMRTSDAGQPVMLQTAAYLSSALWNGRLGRWKVRVGDPNDQAQYVSYYTINKAGLVNVPGPIKRVLYVLFDVDSAQMGPNQLWRGPGVGIPFVPTGLAAPEGGVDIKLALETAIGLRGENIDDIDANWTTAWRVLRKRFDVGGVAMKALAFAANLGFEAEMPFQPRFDRAYQQELDERGEDPCPIATAIEGPGPAGSSHPIGFVNWTSMRPDTSSSSARTDTSAGSAVVIGQKLSKNQRKRLRKKMTCTDTNEPQLQANYDDDMASWVLPLPMYTQQPIIFYHRDDKWASVLEAKGSLLRGGRHGYEVLSLAKEPSVDRIKFGLYRYFFCSLTPLLTGPGCYWTSNGTNITQPTWAGGLETFHVPQASYWNRLAIAMGLVQLRDSGPDFGNVQAVATWTRFLATAFGAAAVASAQLVGVDISGLSGLRKVEETVATPAYRMLTLLFTDERDRQRFSARAVSAWAQMVRTHMPCLGVGDTWRYLTFPVPHHDVSTLMAKFGQQYQFPPKGCERENELLSTVRLEGLKNQRLDWWVTACMSESLDASQRYPRVWWSSFALQQWVETNPGVNFDWHVEEMMATILRGGGGVGVSWVRARSVLWQTYPATSSLVEQTARNLPRWEMIRYPISQDASDRYVVHADLHWPDPFWEWLFRSAAKAAFAAATGGLPGLLSSLAGSAAEGLSELSKHLAGKATSPASPDAGEVGE